MRIGNNRSEFFHCYGRCIVVTVPFIPFVLFWVTTGNKTIKPDQVKSDLDLEMCVNFNQSSSESEGARNRKYSKQRYYGSKMFSLSFLQLEKDPSLLVFKLHYVIVLQQDM